MIWLAQNLTAVIFAGPVTSMGPVFEMYKTIVGKTPTMSKQDDGPTGVISQAAGHIDQGILSINVQYGRLNIILSPDEKTPSLQSAPPVLGDIDDAISTIVSFAEKAVDCLNLNPLRIAVTASLIQRADSKENAIKLFCDATGINRVPDAACDLQFSLNIRKSFGSSGWEMNRLGNWSIGNLQWMQIQMGPSGTSQTIVDGGYFASMIADVNTVPKMNTPLGTREAISAFGDLTEELKKIISEGYSYLAHP